MDVGRTHIVRSKCTHIVRIRSLCTPVGRAVRARIMHDRTTYTHDGHEKNTPYGAIFGRRSSKKYPLWGIFPRNVRIIFWFHQKNTPYSPDFQDNFRPAGLKLSYFRGNCGNFGDFLSIRGRQFSSQISIFSPKSGILGLFSRNIGQIISFLAWNPHFLRISWDFRIIFDDVMSTKIIIFGPIIINFDQLSIKLAPNGLILSHF